MSQGQEEFSQIRPELRKNAKFSFFRKVKNLEERELYLAARANGWLLPASEFKDEWEKGGKLGGAEHDIHPTDDGAWWIKKNNLSYHLSFLEYFNRIKLHNHMFPEAPVMLIGFVVEDNHLWPVTKQPHIPGGDRPVTSDEVDRYMRGLGFDKVPGKSHDYYNKEYGVTVEDLHDENVIIDVDGGYSVIDPVIYLDDEGKERRLNEYDRLDDLIDNHNRAMNSRLHADRKEDV